MPFLFIVSPILCSPIVSSSTKGSSAAANKSPRRVSKRPYGYWKDASNLSAELRDFAEKENGDSTRMPTNAELMAKDRGDLAGAVRRSGTWVSAARRANLRPTSIVKPRSLYLSYCTEIRGAKANNYWKDFENLRTELEMYKNKMPTANTLREIDPALIRAIRNHGGFSSVAGKLGLETCYKPAKYWNDFDNVRKHLSDFISTYGQPGVMPSISLLKSLSPPGLLSAIVSKHGGATKVAKKMGLKCVNPRRPHGYWKSTENRKEELRQFAKLIGEFNHMPTFAEMLRHGRTDLATALARYDGFSNAAKYLVEDEEHMAF